MWGKSSFKEVTAIFTCKVDKTLKDKDKTLKDVNPANNPSNLTITVHTFVYIILSIGIRDFQKLLYCC